MVSDSASGANNAESAAAPQPALLFLLKGATLQSAADVALFLGLSHSYLMYALYKAPESERYRTFEIPKRTGGMRLICAPRGVVRTAQEKLAPLLLQVYDAHPSAHGFLPARSVTTNANEHLKQRLVLNIDLLDFFPTINFGRVRGLFMARPFFMGPAAAAVMAQIVTHRNGLPQGAPTSPALSNFIAATLDRRLTRLAKENGISYSRYADDITFSTNKNVFPPALAMTEESGRLLPGEALERAIAAAGFAINPRKIRLQTRHQRQTVTGLVVNQNANVQRKRVRKIRAMIHAWEKFGLEAAGAEHFAKYRKAQAAGRYRPPNDVGIAFRNSVYGQLAFLKMVRGREDPIFLKFCARLIDLDPNPSRFIRQMVFGAADFDVFISHASEDKEAIARPIYEALQKRGIKAFLDEVHIGWGENFTTKINTALGAARHVVCVISQNSIDKDWPLAEVNTALAMEVNGQKTTLPVIVGKPDLSKLPLIRSKKWVNWSNDAEAVAAEVQQLLRPPQPAPRAGLPAPSTTSAPLTAMPTDEPAARWPFPSKVALAAPAEKWKPGWREPEETPKPPKPVKKNRGLFGWLFGGNEK
jgi:RNA-directed DNA polymerase